jgi:parallel beta-helix repeat protein
MKRKNLTPPVVVILTIIMLLLAALNITPARAEVNAETYYVDNTSSLGTCSDSLNTGLTPDSPFCTITKGASVAIAGDTVRVLAGTYTEKVVPAHVGSAGSPITFSAAPGVSVTGDLSDPDTNSAFRLITKSYITVDGFTVTGTTQEGIYVLGSNNIIISNNHVRNSGSPTNPNQKSGIFFSGTTDSVINHNTTDHNSYNGIMVTGLSSTITVSNNTSYANSTQTSLANGIMVNSSSNNTIIHNVTYANEDSGIGFYVSSSNNRILGNVSYGNGDHGIDNNNSPNNIIVGNSIQGNVTVGLNLEGTTGSGNATIQNNISVDNGINSPSGLYGNIRVDDLSLTGTTLDYNIVYHHAGYVGSSTVITWGTTPYANLSDFQSDTGQETHGLQSDPLWVSPAPPATLPPNVVVGNYQLSTGSPAIDSANSGAPNEPNLDIEGNPRVDDPVTPNTGAGTRLYDDRGAFEFQPTNWRPTNISLSNSSVAENQPTNTIVGAFSTTDPDAGDTFTYNLIGGTGSTDNASFNISGANLRTSASFNFEVQSSYSIRVRSTDQDGLYFDKAFTITVTNVNETPTDISLNNTSVAENQPTNTVVGTLSTTDPDAGNTFTYTLVSGTGSTDNASFNIAGSSLRTSASFDFETKSSYTIRVRSTDQGGLYFEEPFTITVTNVNETPTDISLSNSSVSENQPINFVIGAFTGSDPDAGNTFTYTLVSGTGSTDNDSFNISSGNLRTSVVFDFDSQHSFSIRVRCTDQGGLNFEQTFTITVTRGLTAYIPLISK